MNALEIKCKGFYETNDNVIFNVATSESMDILVKENEIINQVIIDKEDAKQIIDHLKKQFDL